MTTLEFKRFQMSLGDTAPPAGLSRPLVGLWYDGRGDWEAAHREVQKGDGVDEAWVHAYLHRKEGDVANAGYWYRRCGHAQFSGSLDEEWRQIATLLLARTNDDKAAGQ
jgi:hypothetical protein